MKAIVLRDLGSPDNLRLEEVPDPKPGPGEVVVRLRAAALNHRDLWIWKGQYAGIKLPSILGSDGAGQIATLGEGVDGFRVDQDVVINPSLDWGPDPRFFGPKYRILGMPDDGTYAELIKIPAANVYRKPAGLNFDEAAAIPLAGLTAYRAVVTRANVQAGETVLIPGIGSGVATFALGFAKRLGARVYVTSGSDAKLERAKQLGADGVANYKTADWAKLITEMCDGQGPHVVIDSVGGSTFQTAIAIARPGARLATFGATTGPVEKFDNRRVFWKQISILGTTMGTPTEFEAMLDLFDTGGLKPVIDQVFPLPEAAAAHKRMQDAEQFGKIVLKID